MQLSRVKDVVLELIFKRVSHVYVFVSSSTSVHASELPGDTRVMIN